MKDYLLLFDSNNKLNRIINSYEIYNDEIKSTTLGEVTLTFKIKDDIVDIKKGSKLGVIHEHNKIDLFIVDKIESETIFNTELKVTCLHDFYSIAEEKAITQYVNEGVTLRDAMIEMLKGTSYELGVCVDKPAKSIGPYLFKNVLYCIQNIIEIFGVEIYYSIELNESRTSITKKKINIVNALGEDTGIRCSTDLNVSKIKSIEKDKFYTVMYGCGAEYQKDLVKYKYSFKDIAWSEPSNPADKPLGNEYVEDKEAIAKYGRRIGIYEDGRVKDPELLLKKTWEALKKNNKPFVSYELDIEELKTEDGYEHLDFKLGDLIILQNTNDNSRTKFRIIEDIKSVSDKNKRKVVVGEQVKGLTSGGGNNGDGGNIIPPGGGDSVSDPELDDIIPDTLPEVPIVEAKGLWQTVEITWTYENKMYYDYELYASKIKDFEPTVFNLVYNGKASAFLHEVKPKETWYYRARAINTHGSTTEFSEQVEATTTKLSDGAQYFEEAAIGHALIKDLDADKIITGRLKGTYIDARNLSVTDGNNNKTFDIDSFGNINIQATTLKIVGKDVATKEDAKTEADKAVNNQTQSSIFNKLTNNGAMQGLFMQNGELYVNASYLKSGYISGNMIYGGIIEGTQLKTSSPTEYGGMWIRDNGMQLGGTSLMYSGTRFTIESNHNIGLSSRSNIHLMPSGYVNISGKCYADSFELGDGYGAYVKYGSFYSPFASGYLSTYAIKLNECMMLGTSSGSMHFITGSGGKATIYANYISNYSIESTYEIDNTKALDKIEMASVIDNKVIPNSTSTFNTNSSDNILDEYVKINESGEVEMDLRKSISLLWKSVQELKNENNLLKEEIKGMKDVNI